MNKDKISGTFIEHAPCNNPDCGSSDALAIYQDTETKEYNGYCFKCLRFDPAPYGKGTVVNPEERPSISIGGELAGSNTSYLDTINGLPTIADSGRKTRAESRAHFGIKSELSRTDGTTVVAHYYPYHDLAGNLTSYKCRRLPKDLSAVGHHKNLKFFGQAQAERTGGHRLFVVEGEEDAVALYQALKDRATGGKWQHLEPAVVSVCNGAQGSIKDFTRNTDFVKSFQEVVLVFDQDEAGQQAVSEILKLIPTAKVAKFEEKDPSDMLVKGKGYVLTTAVLFEAKTVKPSSVVSVDDVFDRAIALPQMGLSWPWPTLTRLTYGIHRKKVYGLGAGVGIGKTDWAKELESHLVNNHKLPVGAIMLEEDVGRTLKGIAGKFCKKQFHVPDGSFTQQELIDGIESLKGKVFLYDHFGCKDWEDVKYAIRYMVAGEGVRDIFLDPLTALVSHLSAAEANDTLNTIMGELAGLTHELDFSAYYFCHLNTPQNGPPHERGGKVNESQFTGSRSMMRWSHYIFGLERNKDPELPEYERNTSHMVILKDREFGSSGRFPIVWDRATGSYLEPAPIGF